MERKYILVFAIVCSNVELLFSLTVNKTAVCKKNSQDGSTWLQCCPGYKLNNNDECDDCPLGTYGENCKNLCKEDYFGLRCTNTCKCTTNERCDTKVGCKHVEKDKQPTTDDQNRTTGFVVTTFVVLLAVGTGIAIGIWKKRFIICHNSLPTVFGTGRRIFIQSRAMDDVSIDDEDHYSEIRESIMVRPMTAYGRQLSYIRTSDHNHLDTYHHLSDIKANTVHHLMIHSGTNTEYNDPLDIVLQSTKAENSNQCSEISTIYQATDPNKIFQVDNSHNINIRNSKFNVSNPHFNLKATDECSNDEHKITNDTNNDVEFCVKSGCDATEKENEFNDDYAKACDEYADVNKQNDDELIPVQNELCPVAVRYNKDNLTD